MRDLQPMPSPERGASNLCKSGRGSIGWIVEWNPWSSGDEFRLCAGVEEKRSNIESGGPGAQHRHFPALESTQIAMLRTMRDQRAGNRREQRRQVRESHDARSHHDLPCPYGFARGGCQFEAVA